MTTVIEESSSQRPDYKPLARTLLEEIRAFFADPQHEAEYQEWLRERKEE